MPEEHPAELTRQVAAFAAGLRFEDLPGPVAAKVKLHVLDTLGCGVAGAGSSLARSLLAFLALEHGDGPCPVVGCGRRFGPAAAAFANAAAMNALDFDDGFEIDGRGMGHPGATIVAAAVSAATAAGRAVDGRGFLAAVAAAYEVNNRLILAMQPSIERFRAVYGVCQHQSVAAAVAFGRIAGLGGAGLENAIGFAGTLANVPSLRKYNWQSRPLVSLKDFSAPAAEAGVRAVQLETCGLVGAKGVLDGESGLWRMLGSDRFDPGALVAGLGRSWTIRANAFKPYPACRWLHCALEAFERLVAEHAVAAPAIERVTAHTSRSIARDFMDAAPATMVDAQFSLPFALAAIAHGVRPAARWYDPATMARRDVRRLTARVAAVVDPGIDRLMAGPLRRPAGRVAIRFAGREVASETIEHALGSAERPMGDAAIVTKFLENAAPVVGAGRAQALARRLLALEREADVRDVLLDLVPVAVPGDIGGATTGNSGRPPQDAPSGPARPEP